jgi:hypothetical protein
VASACSLSPVGRLYLVVLDDTRRLCRRLKCRGWAGSSYLDSKFLLREQRVTEILHIVSRDSSPSTGRAGQTR